MPGIREQIGEELYLRLEEEANKEVALAMQMDLIDQYHTEKYYSRRSLLTRLLLEFETFQNKGLKFSPIDIIHILFEAKLLRTTQTEHEYDQRRGGGRMMAEPPLFYSWSERTRPIEEVIETHMQQLNQSIIERTLVTQIRDFNTLPSLGSPSDFFDSFLPKLNLPFEAYFDEDSLIKKHSKHQSGLSEYNLSKAKLYFVSPSIGFTFTGSYSYVHFYASAYLRTFLNMLRIAGFLYKGQIDFGMWKVEIMAPSTSFFLGMNVIGGSFSWEEDRKKPWEKIPDGCLFLSFGYRGITKLFLDHRTFGGIEKFFLENNVIFEKLENPWSKICVEDIAPSLDILSSATQTQDLGAKVLQIYCCLEHLFVPKHVKKDNVKYIIGAINALRPDLLSWFKELYEIRCDYAHKGFVQRDDKTLSLVFNSMTHTVALLTSKLKQL